VRHCVNVVVTCTERKAMMPAAELMLRSFPAVSIEQRSAAWIRQLERSNAPAIPAPELYSGNHWHVARTLVRGTNYEGLDIRLWIASAGYGLVPFDARLKSYSATFSGGADCVGRGSENRQWWERLAEWRGPMRGRARSLSSLVAAEPDVPLIIAASAPYVRAMQHDIEAAAQLSTPDKLTIVSAGLRASGSLASLILPADARFRGVVGGQMHSLNIRIVRHALECWHEWAPDASRLRRLFQRQLDRLPPVSAYNRQPQSDDSVIRFIQESRKLDPKVGHTTLLRRLRDSNRACEQRRFKDLFQIATSEQHS
jgi:hypothetical protein